MSKKGALSAVLTGSCPRCRQGKLFPHPAWKLKTVFQSNAECEICGLQYEREPGFFYGAMYMSYGLSVGIFLVTTFVLYFGFNDPPVHYYVVAITSVALLLYPLLFRYSRIFYLYIFGHVKYDPGRAKH